jgi:hypothetical protein
VTEPPVSTPPHSPGPGSAAPSPCIWLQAGSCAASRLLAEDLLHSDAAQALDRDWQGTPVERPPRVLLVLDDTHLHFAAWMPGPGWSFDDAVPGRFRAGLWQRDLVELFVRDPVGEGYREYHLSPAGEWWMGCFTAPRKEARDGAMMLPAPPDRGQSALTLVERAPAGWQGVLSLPRELLPPGFTELLVAPPGPPPVPLAWPLAAGPIGSVSAVAANLAAMVGEAPRHFLSLGPLPGERPDFHQPARFPRVRAQVSRWP